MPKLLYIQASPRIERSYSSAVARAFCDAFKKANTNYEVETLNLFTTKLPDFDGLAVQAKYSILNGKNPSKEEKQAWQQIEALINNFKSADKFVISTPMWNFGLPYRLKQYFDLLIQPGYTFSYTPETGYKGLVVGKPILVVYARGGEYLPGTPAEAMDYQKPYLELLLSFIGFKDIRTLIVEPTLGPDPSVASVKKSDQIENAIQMAQEF